MQNFLRSCIFQLASSNQDISIVTTDLYKAMIKRLEKPAIEELLSAFLAEVLSTDTTFLIIDGLDECPKMERRIFIDDILPSIITANVKLLITSRKEPDIEKGLKDTAVTISIQNAVVDADIKIHVDNVIANDKILSAMNQKIQQEISTGIVSGSRGM